MASRSISAILWTLVGINFLSLIIGGLITWLGYTIPVRLKQVGLLPELVIVAGSASLVVACIGLCALNYSSPNALNIYACSCALFILMLVLGIPESWYKSTHFVRGTLLLDIIYFALLFLLLLLLVFAITLAQYMRRRDSAGAASGFVGNNNNNNNVNVNVNHRHRRQHSSVDEGFRSSNSDQHSRLLALGGPCGCGGPVLAATAMPQAASSPQCTCNVMITAHADPSRHGHDNSNQNNNTNNHHNNTHSSSIIDRWFSRLKPSAATAAAALALPQTTNTSSAARITSGFSSSNNELNDRSSPLADHYLGAPNAAALPVQPTTTSHHHWRSYSSNNNHDPYQHRSRYRQRQSCCSCMPPALTTLQAAAEASTLPPLVSRGTYHQQERERHNHEICRSAGNLCIGSGNKDQERRDNFDDREQQRQLQQEALSRDDTSIKYSATATDAAAAAAAADGCWFEPDELQQLQRQQPGSLTVAGSSSSFGRRLASSNANCQQQNYRRPSSGFCASSMSQHQHQQPMINSSLSVYSISGGVAGSCRGGSSSRRHNNNNNNNNNLQTKHAAAATRSSSSGRFSIATSGSTSITAATA